MIGYGSAEISTELENEVTQFPCVANDQRCLRSGLCLEGLPDILEHGNGRLGALGSDPGSEIYLVHVPDSVA